jgi:hypothetical protein
MVFSSQGFKFAIFKKEKPPSLAVFLEIRFVSFVVSLLRELTAFPPPLGWNS